MIVAADHSATIVLRYRLPSKQFAIRSTFRRDKYDDDDRHRIHRHARTAAFQGPSSKRRLADVGGCSHFSGSCSPDRRGVDRRTLRSLPRQREGPIRERACASPRTQDREGGYAAHAVVVDGGTVASTAPQAVAGDRVRGAFDDHAASAFVAIPFLARRGARDGHRRRNCKCGRAARSAQLSRRVALDDDFDAVRGTRAGAVGRTVPWASARFRWPAARRGHRGEA